MTTERWIGSAARVALATGLLLLVPWVAMQLTDEVDWGWGDFAAAGLLLFAAGMSCVAGAPAGSATRRRVVVGLATLAATAVVWAELAVGLFR